MKKMRKEGCRDKPRASERLPGQPQMDAEARERGEMTWPFTHAIG